jgi:signal transduction histidine kinase
VGADSVSFALKGEAEALSAPRAAARLRFTELKVEAGLFLLILISFAAVLGESAITSQRIILSEGSGRFLPYAFSDADDGGKTTAHLDPKRPMAWSCEIRAGVEYPYCGYGLQLNVAKAMDGVNLSKIKTVTLRFKYHGDNDKLLLSVKTALPDQVAKKTGSAELPAGLEFPVTQGQNELTLPLDRLAAEQWFVSQHQLSPDEAAPDLAHALALGLITRGVKPGKFNLEIEEIVLEGAYLTPEQWYLVILGVWLVVTGGFLVHRFFHMRRRYEARQHLLAAEGRILAQAHADAEAASGAKSKFLSNMSHELRTPLNAIIGYAYWLDHRELGAKEREAAKTIRSSGEHLLAVITDILDISKIEAGMLELLPGPFDLHDCVAGVGQMFRLKAAEMAVAFDVEVAPDVPRTIVADQKRVRQVLINLLGNAVKFTKSGRIALSLSLAPQGSETRRLCIVVEDTGIGIPEHQLVSIFRPFEQAGDAAGRSGGTGLGLSITKQIVDLMNGYIRVESKPGVGSRFIIEVDADFVDDGLGAKLPAPAPTAMLPAPEIAMTGPGQAELEKLLDLARAGNLPALRREAKRIKAEDPTYTPFAERLDALCAAYQSPAVLQLIESMSHPEVVQ